MRKSRENWDCSACKIKGFRMTFLYLKGPTGKMESDFFTRACSARTRGNGFKLK